MFDRSVEVDPWPVNSLAADAPEGCPPPGLPFRRPTAILYAARRMNTLDDLTIPAEHEACGVDRAPRKSAAERQTWGHR